ncbi:MAG: RNA pseudouridine synthase [bacterium]|nr:RNA pseudouridine synthase [bacterium]
MDERTEKALQVLYVDNHLLAVHKPSGVLVQGDRTGDRTLLEHAKAYVKVAFNKPGNVFLGLVHRLDRPTSGVVVFARTSKAASRLSEQFRSRQVKKVYWALVEGRTAPEGKLVDRVVRNGPTSQISDGPDGQEAALSFRCLGYHNGVSWVEVDLQTGRHHQIRVQFAHQGHPVLGDFRYGSKTPVPGQALGLLARSLTLIHPTQKETLMFQAEPEAFWPERFR